MDRIPNLGAFVLWITLALAIGCFALLVAGVASAIWEARARSGK